MNHLDSHDRIGCPDAEMLAAWSDGGLRAEERARVENHAAACGRCQAHLAALARTADVEAPATPRASVLRLWPWLVPTAGAAAAVTIWLIVQPPAPVPAPRQQTPQVAARDEAGTRAAIPAPAPEPDEAPRLQSAPARSTLARRTTEKKLEARADERRDRVVSPKPSTGTGAANEAPTAPPASPVLQERITISAARADDASAIGGLAVHRSPEGRVTWESQPAGISAQLTAGASPSPPVIWLVGRGGLVLLSIDGRSWRRLRFPEAIDLTGIDASSATTAAITTVDARVFTTSDGGETWQRK